MRAYWGYPSADTRSCFEFSYCSYDSVFENTYQLHPNVIFLRSHSKPTQMDVHSAFEEKETTKIRTYWGYPSADTRRFFEFSYCSYDSVFVHTDQLHPSVIFLSSHSKPTN
jgi:hypothetical protein